MSGAAIKTYSDIAGYAGTAITVVGYLAFAGGFMGTTAYFGVGVFTSALLALHGIERRSRPLLTLNIAWATISLVGLGRALL